jgi:integrase
MLYPEVDWKWHGRIARRLKHGAVPKRKPHISSEQLYQVGLDLMGSCLATETPTKAEILAYRDGLQIALLSDAPVRRRAFWALDLGQHLVNDGSAWTLCIHPEDSKTKTAIEYPIRSELVPYIQHYLERIRPRFPGAERGDWLWPSLSGQRLGADTMLTNIKKRTQSALGYAVSIHAFRRAAATLWAEHDPKNVRGSADLLGHTSLRTTQRHYNMASARLAGRAVARAIDAVKADLGVGRRARRKRRCTAINEDDRRRPVSVRIN